MKKIFIFTIILYMLLMPTSFSQSKDSYIYEFLGKSNNYIQKIWGYPERIETDSEGYLLWYYTFNYSQRIFYFDNNEVEMCQSILMVNDYKYALQLADALESSILSNNFWITSQDKNKVIYTNGKVDISAQITNYNNKFVFQLITYR